MIQARLPAAVYLAVGDSSAARFDGLILEHPSGPIVMKARWQPVSLMRDLFHDGKISAYLTRILMEMRFVKRTPDASWPFPRLPERIAGGDGPAFNYKPRNTNRCVLLFCCETDVFELAHQYHPDAFDEASARAAVQSRCEPLFDAIRALHAMGYANIFLHDPAPPSRAEGPNFPPYTVWLRLLLICREVFKDFAERSETGYISIWDETFSEEEARNPQFVHDPVHLNAISGALSAQRLCEELERRGFYGAMAGAQAE